MEQDVRERFERIEGNLENMAEQQSQHGEWFKEFRAGMIELEAAQKNTTIALNKFIDETRERITNLAILVDLPVKKNLSGH